VSSKTIHPTVSTTLVLCSPI